MPDRRLAAAAFLLAVAIGAGSRPATAQEQASPPATGTAIEPPEPEIEPPDPDIPPPAAVPEALAPPAPEEAAPSPEAYDPLFDDQGDEEPLLEVDPFESGNRYVFSFNEGVGRYVLDPITHAYQWLVPPPGRRAVNRVFDNLNAPVRFANQVLQLRPVPAAGTLTRFVVNSSLGIGGIFDVAHDVMHLSPTDADFGQTLARYRVPRGPYLVVPLFGPSTTRDALGTVVDQALDPLTYIVGPLNFQWQLILGGSQGLALRDENLEALQALREASVDFYSALRSAYLQVRLAREVEVGYRQAVAPTRDDDALQDSAPEASAAIRASMAAIKASKFSRLTIPENSDLRSASSLTVPSR
jgi:phospholipid-binding lipoprotein MlaA